MFLQRMMRTLNNISITDDLATTAVIDALHTSGGMIYVNTGASLTTLTWYACHKWNGTYLPVMDGIGGAITTDVVLNESCLLPPALFGAAYLKAVGDNVATVTVSLKA